VSNVDFDLLASRFRQFAELECRDSSRLYGFLATAIADDQDLLVLASRAQSHQPVPNLLFAAVHYLLLSGKDHELKSFYPSIVVEPQDHNTAAGLNLIWDRYSYSYGDGQVFGAEGSSVRITSSINGPHKPSLKDQPPPVTYRVGVDVRIVDLTDDDHLLWLRSLIWPEHKDQCRGRFKSRSAQTFTR